MTSCICKHSCCYLHRAPVASANHVARSRISTNRRATSKAALFTSFMSRDHNLRKERFYLQYIIYNYSIAPEMYLTARNIYFSQISDMSKIFPKEDRVLLTAAEEVRICL